MASMTTRLPRLLVQRRAELAYERVTLARRAAEVDAEVTALDTAIKALDPSWKPPTKIGKPCKAATLPRGAVSTGCLSALREHPVLWTHEIAAILARDYGVEFKDRRAELDFASATAMALRRYERRGFLEVVERDATTGALRWRIRRDSAGEATFVRPELVSDRSA
jgi:hypothetical protein